MKNHIKFLLILMASYLSVSAQQDPQFSHFMFSNIAQNPARAGVDGGICATAIHRSQWVGFTGAPTTSFFAVDGAISPFGIKSGLSLKIVDDKLGAENNFDLKLGYAYHFEAWDGLMSVGMDFGIVNKKIDGNWKFPDSAEPIPTNANDNSFDMDLGVFYKKNNFYTGLSASHLLAPEITLNQQQSTRVNRHYYLTAGYSISNLFPSFDIEPSVWVQSDGSSAQISINTNVVYNKKIWGGVTYRAGDSVIALLGLELINGLRLGYAYDVTTSDISKYDSGSHEVFLKYCFEVSVPQYTHKYKSARFL